MITRNATVAFLVIIVSVLGNWEDGPSNHGLDGNTATFKQGYFRNARSCSLARSLNKRTPLFAGEALDADRATEYLQHHDMGNSFFMSSQGLQTHLNRIYTSTARF